MTTHGSVFSAAGQALIGVAADVLPDWVVRYELPRSPKETMTELGEPKLVWVGPLGGSTFGRASVGLRGMTETCSVTLIFHREYKRSDLALSEVDDEVAEAFGAVLEALSARQSWTPPDGWGRIDFTPTESAREGGYLPSLPGVVRRLEVTFDAVASRC